MSKWVSLNSSTKIPGLDKSICKMSALMEGSHWTKVPATALGMMRWEKRRCEDVKMRKTRFVRKLEKRSGRAQRA